MTKNATEDGGLQQVEDGQKKAEHLREDGHLRVADFVEGIAGLQELDLPAMLDLVGDTWVVRLYDDENEKQFTKATDGTLIQCNDTGRTGEFGHPYEAWPEEFDDYLFSGQWVVEVIYPEESGFEVTYDE